MTPPTTIAHYRITSKLGEGGMGAVYRATDTKLNRDVAIKILPETFAADPDRLARFTREAQVLASLNHPNIAQIYGVEDRALVMEFIAGETLHGPLPLDTALDFAGQIAAALGAAHEKGIIHRDLKPANIMVTPAGAVKVLDFGLAAVALDSSGAADPENSPTLTMAATRAGVIMGTAGYMSPEQARGAPVDKRADIWAFGVVLYEMLTGARLFDGATVSDALASILKETPDLTRTPVEVRCLLAACLEKDPKKRLRDIGDWQRLLTSDSTAPAPSSRTTNRTPWIAAALLAIAAAAGWAFRPFARPAAAPLLNLDVQLADGVILGPRYPGHLFAISPDGARFVVAAADPNASSGTSLALRDLRAPKFTILPGTEGAHSPFFSPDGKWIGFWSDGKIRKVPADGGAVLALCDLPSLRGGAWLDDGQIVLSSVAGPLLKVAAEGGKPVPLTTLAAGETTHRQPQYLPGSRVVTFASTTMVGDLHHSVLHAFSLKTGQRKVIFEGAIFGRQLPTGHLVFLKDGTLFAAPFDSTALELRGAPVPVLERVRSYPVYGGFLSIADTGAVVYGLSTPSYVSVYRIERGKALESFGLRPGDYFEPELSPDGKRLAYLDYREDGANDLAVADLERGTTTRLSSKGGAPGFVWTRDGARIVYWSESEHGLAWIRADGGSPAETLTRETDEVHPESFSPDGKTLLITAKAAGSSGDFNLYSAPFSPGAPKIIGPRSIFLDANFTARDPAFSPDGRWVAYHSTEDGSSKVYVRPFPGPGPRVLISRGWGQQPRWSRTEILYQGGDRRIMAVPFTVRGANLLPGEPVAWTSGRAFDYDGWHSFDFDPSRNRVVVMALAGGKPDNGENSLYFALNFFDEVRRKVALP